jgi:hypothetical protein
VEKVSRAGEVGKAELRWATHYTVLSTADLKGFRLRLRRDLLGIPTGYIILAVVVRQGFNLS